MINKFLLFGLLLAAGSSSFAQKMSVLDYFKAFSTNINSPNNQLAAAKQELSIQPSSNPNEYIIKYYTNQSRTSLISVDTKNSFLAYKQGGHEGWNGQCYPTFKVYTKADGTQILGVTEDSYTHHSYKSKYGLSAPTMSYPDDYLTRSAAIRRNRSLSLEERNKQVAELEASIEKDLRTKDPYHLWNARPKPIKFWTYNAGNWTEVTDQVMSEFFTLEQMIDKTALTPQAGLSVSEHIFEHAAYLIYPLYRIEPDKNEITVWVDEARIKLFTTEIEQFANPSDNLASRKSSMPEYWDFLTNTTFKSYTLVWDEKKGQFVRK